MSDPIENPEMLRAALLEAITAHVPFDGWTEPSFAAACHDLGVAPTLARAFVPRGALDLAADYHRAGDAAMVAALSGDDLGALRFRERVAHALRLRLDVVSDREAVRRGCTLFALPPHAAEGARLIWGTADRIWTALGDDSRDLNWYTKRTSLSAVYGAAVLFWLGDESEGHAATHAFIERRIDQVMRIETMKARLRESPALSRMLAGPIRLAGRIRAPGDVRGDVPGGAPAPLWQGAGDGNRK